MKSLYIDLCTSGINDIFSTLAYYINYYKEHNWDLQGIHFSSKIYENLLNYLDISTINYVLPTHMGIRRLDFEREKESLKNKYDILHFHERPFVHCTNLNIGNKYHLSNFIKIKNYIIQESKPWVSPNAIHLRFMGKENKLVKLEDSILNYKKGITNLIEDFSKDYTIISSAPFEFLDDLATKHINIKYVPKSYLAFKDRMKTKDVFLDLAILSQSNIIYKTEGSFTETAKMFGNGMPVVESLIG